MNRHRITLQLEVEATGIDEQTIIGDIRKWLTIKSDISVQLNNTTFHSFDNDIRVVDSYPVCDG